MKQLNNLEFVKLAVSTDKTRYTICHIYRDKNEIVGTDGHRMHWINSLPDEAPHFLDGFDDAVFPDWRIAVPKVEAARVLPLFSSKIEELRKRLEVFVSANQKLKLTAAEKRKIRPMHNRAWVHLKVDNSSIEGHYEVRDLELKFRFPHEAEIEVSEDVPWEIRLDCQYLLDALKMEDLGKIDVYFPEDPLTAVSLENGFDRHAVIMPVRME